MAVNIKIDFGNCYETKLISSDLSFVQFETELTDSTKVSIRILISDQPHPFLPQVYNLAFGPIHKEDRNKIDDQIQLKHIDHSKVFSTIVLVALTFLIENPDKYLGIDGSNNTRAYLYFRIIQNNYELLSEYFEIFGIKYYVRILRKKKDSDEEYPIDTKDINAAYVEIEKGHKITLEKMYNYFIFRIAKK